MRRLPIWVALVAAVWLSTATASARRPAVPRGLPAGAATAALRPEPPLPAPRSWGFPDAFSRTSGTGRLTGGAFEWTDWLYDAYGASSPQGLPLNPITSAADSLSPAQGQYVYPAGPASNDGADIFRAAVGLTRSASVWRIDWNTLVSPSVPIAEWSFDTDDNAKTGVAAWPASANVISPGIDWALVVSARGARLLNPANGRTIATFPTEVDHAARSFLVHVPRDVLPVGGRWRIRLAAGLADPSGASFAVPTLSNGTPAAPTAPRVYNITFRTAAQEPTTYLGQSDIGAAQTQTALASAPLLSGYGIQGVPGAVTANWWAEDDQADTLATGNVSKFSQVVDWAALAARRRTSPPLVRGWSDRWYETDLKLGQGVNGASNANPAFLSRVQPYAVYVPSNYNGRRRLPLTWMLHSASVNYNQYGVINPRLVREACQQRDTICASPEGFGGEGLYQGIAEHDFWQVWRQVALSYRVLATRTVMTGYSMGGLASFVLPTTYPSDFAQSMPLDGGFDEGCTSATAAGASQEDIAAAVDRTSNVRWVPFVISDSYSDELSPYPAEVAEVSRFEAAGDRFTFYSTTAPEHITTDTLDGFSTQVSTLHGTPAAVARPGTIDYTWCPEVLNKKLGLGPTSVYWLSGLRERTAPSPSTVAHLVAADAAIPTPSEAEQVAPSAVDPSDAPPMQVITGSWKPGPIPRRGRTLTLKLTNVAAVTVNAAAAKLRRGMAIVSSDGTVRLTLTHLRRGTRVRTGRRVVRIRRNGRVTTVLRGGTTRISWR